MAKARKLGTFGGVFTPSILTILGVIMYLRLPWIVGQAGFWMTAGIILVAHLISVTTGLSVASIATDKRVQAGGTYYMISRSLGLSIGGTLGLALFVGLSFSVSLYLIGFSESLLGFLGREATIGSIRLTGSIALAGVTAVTLISTALAIRTQYLIMAAIGLSLATIFLGSPPAMAAAPLLRPVAGAAPFIVLFGIFFPAVTGFEAGVSMSGDLKDPKGSIPKGTIAAIGFGLVVYLGLAAYFAWTVPSAELTGNPRVLLDLSFWPPIVLAGIWGATVSSALGSILGAPRILQATAADGILPRWLARGHGPENEPRNALLVTFLIAEAGILIGELDLIARVVSMFFITTYGFLNLSAAIENWASPDFRPEFRIPAWVSVLGSATAFIVMIELDFLAMVGATLVLGAVFFGIKRRQLALESGDAWEGVWSSLIRTAVDRLLRGRGHSRNWRPNLLLFSEGAASEPALAELGGWLARRRGLLTDFRLETDLSLGAGFRVQPAERASEERGLIVRAVRCGDPQAAALALVQGYGFAGVEPNTVLLGWPEAGALRAEGALGLVRAVRELDRNLLLLRAPAESPFGERRRLEVWVRGEARDLGLSLALLRFLTESDDWSEALVELVVVRGEDLLPEETVRLRLERALADARIDAVVQVLRDEGGSLLGRIAARPEPADLVVLPLDELGPLDTAAQLVEAGERLAQLPAALLLDGASSFAQAWSGLLPSALPEWGASAGVEDVAALPLALPTHPRLAALAAPLALQLEELAEGFLQRFERPATADELSPREPLTDAVERGLAGLAKALDGGGGEAARRRALSRLQADLLFQAARRLDEYAAETPALQRRRLEEGLEWLHQRLEGLTMAQPERLELEPEGDGGRKRRLAPRRLLRGILEEELPLLEAALLRRLALQAFREIQESQALLRQGLEALGRVERAYEERPELAAEPRQRESEALERGLSTLRAARAAALDQAGREWLAGWRELESRLLAALGGVAAGKAVRAAERRDRREAADEALPRWFDGQASLLALLRLDLRLLTIRSRLRIAVGRRRQAPLQELAALRVGRVGELLDALDRVLDGRAGIEQLRLGFVLDNPLDGEALVEDLVGEVARVCEDLPEKAEVAGEEFWRAIGEGRLGEAEAATLSLRRLVESQLEGLFVEPLEKELVELGRRLDEACSGIGDAVRLALFQSRLDAGAEARLDERLASLRDCRDRIAEHSATLEALELELGARLDHHLDRAFEKLNPFELARSAGELTPFLLAARPRDALGTAQRLRHQASEILRGALADLVYRRSDALPLAWRLGAKSVGPARTAAPLLEALESREPQARLLEALPFAYRQLFLGRPSVDRESWVGREAELARADEAVRRWRSGRAGALLVRGEPGAGKSSFCQLLAQRHGERGRVWTLAPPETADGDPLRLAARLREATGLAGGFVEQLERLPDGGLVVVHDLSLWWRRREDGLGALEQLAAGIDREGGRLLFLLNGDSHALRLIQRLVDFEGRALDRIDLGPLPVRSLRDLVLQRHRSAGLSLELDGRGDHPRRLGERRISELQLAAFFGRLFERTRGNPGEALRQWVSAVESFEGRLLSVRTRPEAPPPGVEALPPAARLPLLQLMLHRRLTRETLVELCGGPDDAALERELARLQRAGWIAGTGALEINPWLLGSLLRAFQERSLL